MKRSTLLEFSVPVVLVIVLVILSLFTPLISTFESFGYDLALGLRPPVPQSPEITVLEIDDLAIEAGGVFPWPRSTTARGMLLLRELGVDYLTFDMEFLNRSPMGVNSQALQEDVPGRIKGVMDELVSQSYLFAEQIARGQLSRQAALENLPALETLGQEASASVLDGVNSLVEDQDALLGRSFMVFGKSFATINNKIPVGNPDATDYKESLSLVQERFAIKNLDAQSWPTVSSFKTLYPAFPPVVSNATGVGFTNFDPDAGGAIMRRVRLVMEHEGKYYAQLVLAPLLHKWGNPPLRLSGSTLEIQRSRVDPSLADVRIPLNSDGTMMVNWARPGKDKNYEFRQISFGDLLNLEKVENSIATFTSALAGSQLINIMLNEELHTARLERRRAVDAADQAAFDAAVAHKAEVYAALAEEVPQRKAQTSSRIDTLIAQASDDAAREQLLAARRQVDELYDGLAADLAGYQARVKSLKEVLADSFCILGQTGTATTDLGATPFRSEYYNVYAHANVANTIMQGQFLQQLPPVVGLLITVLGMALGVVVSRRLKPLQAALASFGILLSLILASLLVFIGTGIYAGWAVPGVGILASSISLTLFKFRAAEKEKGYIRNAFSRYLSDDVIKQIVANPKALNLGGEKKELTAIFTDVKGFSTISEKLDPSDLVNLLNDYLTVMSDIILDSGGFIDKYEGDAIIAFWGAPVPAEDHARRACLSALRMKRAELSLNERVLAAELSPGPLLTRIGINTGDIVVGNMGTNRRLNYTIMGNAVNLAARLEGVNKQYGTWILISQSTRAEAGEDIVCRRLDRVRVVGINTPVRLYQVVEEKYVLDPAVAKILEAFEAGLDLFEDRQWQAAAERFQEALKLDAEDGPSKKYLQRCQDFLKTPPASNWDGVFNMSEK